VAQIDPMAAPVFARKLGLGFLDGELLAGRALRPSSRAGLAFAYPSLAETENLDATDRRCLSAIVSALGSLLAGRGGPSSDDATPTAITRGDLRSLA